MKKLPKLVVDVDGGPDIYTEHEIDDVAQEAAYMASLAPELAVAAEATAARDALVDLAVVLAVLETGKPVSPDVEKVYLPELARTLGLVVPWLQRQIGNE